MSTGSNVRISTNGSPVHWLLRLPVWTALGLVPALFAARWGDDGSTLDVGTVAADRVLTALTAFTLPTLALAAFGSLGRTGQGQADETFLRFGESRRPRLLENWIGRTLLVVVLYTTLTGVLLAWARSSSDPLLRSDLLATLPAAALCALTAGALFGAAVIWGGRLAVVITLIVVWTVGHFDLVIAGLVPVGHMRHLLGLGESLPWPQWGSSLVLLALSSLLTAAAFVRVPR